MPVKYDNPIMFINLGTSSAFPKFVYVKNKKKRKIFRFVYDSFVYVTLGAVFLFWLSMQSHIRLQLLPQLKRVLHC